MEYLLKTVLMGMLNALFIIGVWNSMLPGQILGPLGDWMAGNSKTTPLLEGHVPDWINKPLFLCPMCQASLHGVTWWIVFQMGPWFFIPVYVVCLSGIMKLIVIHSLNHDKEG